MSGTPAQNEIGAQAAWRYLVPNLFTAASAGLGLASVLLSIEHQFYWGAWCVLWCVLLDKVDGTAARLLHATSPFGSQFDSLADLLSFGLAPAVLVYCAGRLWLGAGQGDMSWWLLTLGCGWFALMAAIRLARFNASQAARRPRHFVGIPTTLCGAVIPSAVLVIAKYELPAEVIRGLPVLLVLLGLGMVSRLPVPKVVPRRARWFNIFQWANVAAVYVCGMLMVFPEYFLALAVIYISVGSIHGLLRVKPTDPVLAGE